MAESKKEKSEKNYSNLFVPAAIIIAGVVIGAAVIFTNGRKSGGNTNTAGTSAEEYKYQKYVDIAQDINLKPKKFKECMDEYDVTEVKNDRTQASSYGVTGTPSFYIGIKGKNNEIEGIKIVGAQPYDQFANLIDPLLKQKSVSDTIKEVRDELELNFKEQYKSIVGTEEGDKTLSQILRRVGEKAQTISMDDDPAKGNKDAEVVIIEFTDYECPFCKRFYDSVYKRLQNNYVDPGNVLYVVRDFPLPFHDPVATEKAVAANCARKLGGDDKYFEYHDQLFERAEQK